MGPRVTISGNNTIAFSNASLTSGQYLTWTNPGQVVFGHNNSDASPLCTYINIGGSAWSGPSDRRLKTDINSIDVGLGFINSLDPVSFKWKDIDRDGFKTYYGFVAQDIKKSIDLFNIQDNDIYGEVNGYGTLAPSSLIPFMVKSIQQLSINNKELSSQLATSQQTIKSQHQTIDTILVEMAALKNIVNMLMSK